ncbi:hypothetical protein KDK77_03950 [bacterium]|nr:hypothetical protein [bacterium]
MKTSHDTFKTFMKQCVGLGILLLIGGCFIGLIASHALAAGEGAADTFSLTPVHADVMKWAFLAAAISVGLGSVGTGIAVAYVGSSALGVVGEKPEMAPRALIFVGLAEGIAIYGLIIAIMILVRI